jgi:hypothetical protein
LGECGVQRHWSWAELEGVGGSLTGRKARGVGRGAVAGVCAGGSSQLKIVQRGADFDVKLKLGLRVGLPIVGKFSGTEVGRLLRGTGGEVGRGLRGTGEVMG